MRNRETRGFTLIELLVVIAIIGILSSVVLASLNSAREKGRDARRISDIKQIQLALELYYDANGSEYPDDIYDSTLAPTYMASVPVDPQGSNDEYEYEAVNDGRSYILKATMEGAVPAGDLDGTQGSGIDCADTTPANGYCVRP